MVEQEGHRYLVTISLQLPPPPLGRETHSFLRDRIQVELRAHRGTKLERLGDDEPRELVPFGLRSIQVVTTYTFIGTDDSAQTLSVAVDAGRTEFDLDHELRTPSEGFSSRPEPGQEYPPPPPPTVIVIGVVVEPPQLSHSWTMVL